MKIFFYNEMHQAIEIFHNKNIDHIFLHSQWYLYMAADDLATQQSGHQQAMSWPRSSEYSGFCTKTVNTLKVHSHWCVRACGPALRDPHCGPTPNVHTWIKRKCSHWRVRTCGPACGEKPTECHAVISRTRKLFFGLFMTFWGLES